PEFELADEVRRAILGAADALRGQGMTVEAVAPPLPPGRMVDTYLRMLFPILMAGAPDAVYDGLVGARDGALAALRDGAGRYGGEASAAYATASFREVERARTVREELKNQLSDWFAGWDAILAPISPVPAFGHNQAGRVADRTLEVDGRAVPYSRMFDWIALA